MFTKNDLQYVADVHKAANCPLERPPELDTYENPNDIIEFGDFFVREITQRKSNGHNSVYTQYTYDLYEWVPATEWTGEPKVFEQRIRTGLSHLADVLEEALVERERWAIRRRVNLVDYRPSDLVPEEVPF